MRNIYWVSSTIIMCSSITSILHEQKLSGSHTRIQDQKHKYASTWSQISLLFSATVPPFLLHIRGLFLSFLLVIAPLECISEMNSVCIGYEDLWKENYPRWLSRRCCCASLMLVSMAHNSLKLLPRPIQVCFRDIFLRFCLILPWRVM